MIEAINPVRPTTILICALGGEGGGVLAQWLVEAAISAGHSVQSTSIPGVAQRTGATTYYVEVFPQPDAALQGRRPVFSLTPVPGALDLLVSSELLETARQVGHGMTSRDRTKIVSSSSRTLTIAEKVALADGRADEAFLAQLVRSHCRDATLIDMGAIASRTGTVLSAVLFGAIAASGALPFGPDVCRAIVRAGGRGVEASVRGFDAAFEAACGAVAVSGIDSGGALPGREQRPQALASSWLLQLPQAVQEVAHLGRARVLEYQDAHYAELYESRLHRIAQAEREADPHARSGMATTRETARHLALWMAFDDIVRVAELKIRSARISRVRAEVGARDGEVLRIYDHFKPTVAEVAAILPRSLAAALTRWDRRRQSRGRSPLAMALKLPTHSIVGMAALRLLVALKPLRPRSSRFHDEQELIERWLVAIEQGVRQSTGLGLELAECGRLIKGYGSTHDRGKDILLHVIATLAGGASTDGVDARTAAVRAARLAALADDTGNALNLTMVRHGAAPMPTREHPVQWVRRRPGGRAGAAQRASTPDRGARP